MITKFEDFLVENKLLMRDAIYDWLGDSKAVTLSGKPIKLYHGTNTKIDKFDDNKINTMEERGDYIGYGFYFINSESKAKMYANRAVRVNGGTPTIIEAYLKIENPRYHSKRK